MTGQLLDNVGLMMEMNHHLLCALGVGQEKLSRLCEVTHKKHLHSKLTGAGGGGCAITLLKDGLSSADLADLQRDIQAECGNVSCWEAEVGGAGVTFHDSLPL